MKTPSVPLRLMTPQPDGSLLFAPTTLLHRPGAEPPLQVVSSREVRLHPWTLEELEPAMTRHGLGVEETRGGMRDEPYLPAESSDLVLLARRQ